MEIITPQFGPLFWIPLVLILLSFFFVKTKVGRIQLFLGLITFITGTWSLLVSFLSSSLPMITLGGISLISFLGILYLQLNKKKGS